jgi:5'-3' exonuclease
MRRIAMLIHYGVTPVIVFDGACLPSKAGEEHDRKKYGCPSL